MFTILQMDKLKKLRAKSQELRLERWFSWRSPCHISVWTWVPSQPSHKKLTVLTHTYNQHWRSGEQEDPWAQWSVSLPGVTQVPRKRLWMALKEWYSWLTFVRCVCVCVCTNTWEARLMLLSSFGSQLVLDRISHGTFSLLIQPDSLPSTCWDSPIPAPQCWD